MPEPNTINQISNTLTLGSPVTDIPRIGPAKAKYLQKLHIEHARDFIYTFPRRYDDFSRIVPIKDLKEGEQATIRAKVKTVKSSYGFQGRRRLLRIFVDLEDDTGIISVTWYNLQFLVKQLWIGRELYVAGKIEANPFYLKQLVSNKSPSLLGASDETIPLSDQKIAASPLAPRPSAALANGRRNNRLKNMPAFRLRSPAMEFIDQNQDLTHTGRIIPIYPETYGVSSRWLRYQVKNLLPLLSAVPEYLPPAIIDRQKLIGIHQAVTSAHFPASSEDLNIAQKRLRFDELFFLQLAALVRRRQRAKNTAPAIKTTKKQIHQFIDQLPFKLTSAQQISLNEIIADLKKSSPMNRLLQGDVGSGKSAVALIAAQSTLHSGHKVMYLAPTEILARQQADSFSKSLGAENVALLIGATKIRDRRQILERIQQDDPICLIGTHSLLNDEVAPTKLGLVIVDEQHRFGVKQRKALLRQTTPSSVKGQKPKIKNPVTPHLLSMTATPIPRTLNLTVYGDLEVSVLDELPAGRQPITTSIISPSQHEQVFIDILAHLHQGRQAYVITPLIEESETLQAKSAQQALKEVVKYFPDIAIELVHGKMPPEQKKSIMENFTAGAIQLLVSTSVVEVGVNVPNATCMIIEGAERFGLAQLHQFRGRVGRGEHQSYCYLFPTEDAGINNPRLTTLAGTTDGFKIAEEDLKLRGPGEVYGTQQSGYGDLKVASLLDYPMIKRTRAEAQTILDIDPELIDHDILRRKVEQKNLLVHLE